MRHEYDKKNSNGRLTGLHTKDATLTADVFFKYNHLKLSVLYSSNYKFSVAII